MISLTLKLKGGKLTLGNLIVFCDISHMVHKGLRSGNLGGLREGSV